MSSSTGSNKKYNGSCACGDQKFTVSLDSDRSKWKLVKCNCPICLKCNTLSVANRTTDDHTTYATFTHKAEKKIGEYPFSRNDIATHFFCTLCGTGLFIDVRAGATALGKFSLLNVCTLDGVDLSEDTDYMRSRHYLHANSLKWDQEKPQADGAW